MDKLELQLGIVYKHWESIWGTLLLPILSIKEDHKYFPNVQKLFIAAIQACPY